MDVMKKRSLNTSVAVLMLAVAGPVLAVPEVSVSASAGYRADNLTWNSASDSVNVSSELNWSDLSAAEVIFDFNFNWGGLYVGGDIGYGAVIDGLSRDSTFGQNDRLGESSRTYSDTGGSVYDLSAYLGYALNIRTAGNSKTYLMPMLGYDFHVQNLNDTNGFDYQADAALGGLDRTYETEWGGLWAGFSVWEKDNALGLTIRADFSVHDGTYYGVADWNLNQEYQHPISFEHWGDSTGARFALTSNYELSEKTDLIFGFSYSTWEVSQGSERVFLSGLDANGVSTGPASTAADTSLNKVEWTSTSVNIGVEYYF